MPELLKAEFHALPDQGRMRYARLEPSRPPRGTILIAPGRREFIEKKYAELGEEFQKRGFRLIFFEWRGQGLSSRFLPEPRRQRDHIADFAIHLDDLRSFYRDIVKPAVAGPLLAFGHSFGGHLMLRWLAEDQPDVRAAIVTAPMLALSLHMAQRIAQAACKLAVQMGHGEDYAPGQHDFGAADRIFAGNPLTHDEKGFFLLPNYFDALPKMVVGGVTWQWLHAALQSMHATEARDYLARIGLPVLAIIGGKDHVTPAAQVGHALKAIPSVETFILPGALHDVMSETDALRAEAWAHIDGFLGKIIPA